MFDLEEKLEEKYVREGYNFILPIIDGSYARWRWGWNVDTIRKFNTEVIVSKNKNGISFYKKQRPELGDLPTKKPKTTFYKPEYSSGNGTNQLKKIFGKKVFDNPKPMDLIKDLIEIGSNPGDLILDSFGGSGTTAEAVLRLNQEKGAKRKFILVELQRKIAENVTKVRIEKTIENIKKNSNLLNEEKFLGFRYYGLGESLIKDKNMNWDLTYEEIAKALFFNFDVDSVVESFDVFTIY